MAQASASAAKALAILSNHEIVREPQVAEVSPVRCTGCMDCAEICFYDAIEEDEFQRRKVARVNAGMCQGCGACVAQCLDGAMEMRLFNDEQIHAEITGLFAVEPGYGQGAPAGATAASGGAAADGGAMETGEATHE